MDFLLSDRAADAITKYKQERQQESEQSGAVCEVEVDATAPAAEQVSDALLVESSATNSEGAPVPETETETVTESVAFGAAQAGVHETKPVLGETGTNGITTTDTDADAENETENEAASASSKESKDSSVITASTESFEVVSVPGTVPALAHKAKADFSLATESATDQAVPVADLEDQEALESSTAIDEAMLVVPPPTIDSALSAAAFLNISAADLDTSSSSTSSLANFEFEYEEGGCEDEDHLDDEETEENVTMNHEGELLSGMRRRKMGNADVDAAQPTSSENANDVQLDLPEASNILEEVWLSIFTPGINSRVVMVMDVCFYALFLVLLGMFVITGANVHVGFLIVITGCLFVSVKWFIAESAKLQAEANLGDAQRAVEPVPEPASKDE